MILALDSSASEGSVALVDGERVVREERVETPRGRGGALFAALEAVMREAGVIERVVVGIGPGSYNGIRAALAAGWGIAAARKASLVGLSSLLGLDEGEYCAVGDARRGQFYLARVRAGGFLEEPCLLEDSAEVLRRVGSSLVYVPAPMDLLPEAEVRMPSAVRLARLGRSALTSKDWPEPIYLKPAFITKPRNIPE